MTSLIIDHLPLIVKSTQKSEAILYKPRISNILKPIIISMRLGLFQLFLISFELNFTERPLLIITL